VAKSAKFKASILSGSNLSNADFSNSYMRNTRLLESNLTGTNFSNADLSGSLMPDGTTYNNDVSQFGATR
ncbi:pentapeptide repeat-containing protein, partial [Planktothrix sp.]